jgi:dTDP-4-amino-4,6-dideoxygalactose transaminase
MFEIIEKFENTVSQYFGATYGVAVDSCTHGLELCLRYRQVKKTSCPNRTYISVPFTLTKLEIDWEFHQELWSDFYFLKGTNIIDAAVLWGEKTYIPHTFMCLSFQYKKHLNLGRGGMILTDNKEAHYQLKKMSYDGRLPNIPWANQNIDTIGYHYYMTPETAELGIEKFNMIKNSKPKSWSFEDYPDLKNMRVFK